jgi:hypothetical protein
MNDILELGGDSNRLHTVRRHREVFDPRGVLTETNILCDSKILLISFGNFHMLRFLFSIPLQASISL